MSGKIFLIGDDEAISSVMYEAPFDNEDRLQAAIEREPDLIPGDQINPEDPRRWLLVRREAGIPDAPGVGDRWSIDHLFVDQDAIPTLVECKNSGNPELRRHVVAQMLDYAANIGANWPAGRARQLAEDSAKATGESLDEQIRDLVGAEYMDSTEQFWHDVDTNLQDGRIRLVFVAPTIPRELQAIADFLNGQMDKTDVVTVEIKLFVSVDGSTARAMVPRVTGRSAFGRAATRDVPKSKISMESLLDTLGDAQNRASLEKVIKRIEAIGARPEMGDLGASWRLQLERPVTICWVFPPGQFGWMGLTDTTLGTDSTQLVGVNESAKSGLENFSKSISELFTPGNLESKKTLAGSSFTANGLTGNLNAVITEIERLGEVLVRS